MKRFSKLIVLSMVFVGALVSMDVLSPNSAEAGCRRERRCGRSRRCCKDACCPAPAPCAGPVCCG